jgi:hypothetical protein
MTNLRRLDLYLGLSIALAITCTPATVTAAKWVVNPGESIQCQGPTRRLMVARMRCP